MTIQQKQTQIIPSTKRKILMICDDMTSHLHAISKLACVYGSVGHYVTVVTTAGPSHDLVVHETSHYSNNVTCIVAGKNSFSSSDNNDNKNLNEAGVTNPNSWQTFWQYLWRPFPFADIVPDVLLSSQESMYEPIKDIIRNGNFDVIVPLHGMVGTVSDAVDSLRTSENVVTMPPIVVFSSFPYDPFTYRGNLSTWFLPRTFTSYPHCGTYSATNRPPNNAITIRYVIQLFWQLVDGMVSTIMYKRSGRIHNEYRIKRGLEPNTTNGYCGWQRRYPTICIGGVEPFLDKESAATAVRPQDTVIGTLDAPDRPSVEMDRDLHQWLLQQQDQADDDDNGIVFVGFGTGVELNEKEAKAVTGDLLRSMDTYEGRQGRPSPKILFALRPSEQKRLRHVFDASVGSLPTSESESHLEYCNGRLRIQVVPQADLLKNYCVRVFVSHMGMGGFTEGVQGGNVFICYPAFADQYFNSQRAIDAGVGVMAAPDLDGLGDLVRQVLDDKDMSDRAKELACTLPDGATLAIEATERIIRESKNSKRMLQTKESACDIIESVQEHKVAGEVFTTDDDSLSVAVAVTNEEEIGRRMSTASAGAA